jgi:brefeldin A-resistance guanine nucleotide exchange factor 1
LKNILLVMNAAGILSPPGMQQTDLQRTLWTNTQERMERFLPGFLLEIIPPPAGAEPLVNG